MKKIRAVLAAIVAATCLTAVAPEPAGATGTFMCNGKWHNTPHAGYTPGIPTIAWTGSSTIYRAVVRGTDNKIWESLFYMNGTIGVQYGPWSEMPGGGVTNQPPKVVYHPPVGTRTYVVGTDWKTYMNQQPSPAYWQVQDSNGSVYASIVLNTSSGPFEVRREPYTGAVQIRCFLT